MYDLLQTLFVYFKVTLFFIGIIKRGGDILLSLNKRDLHRDGYYKVWISILLQFTVTYFYFYKSDARSPC